MRKLAMMVSPVLAWITTEQWASAQQKPNIILIMTDQQRGDEWVKGGQPAARGKTQLYSPNYPKKKLLLSDKTFLRV